MLRGILVSYLRSLCQFLDCVWQIWRQFPEKFEFNEAFLICLAKSYLSGVFIDFGHNSIAWRQQRQHLFDVVRAGPSSQTNALAGAQRFYTPQHPRTAAGTLIGTQRNGNRISSVWHVIGTYRHLLVNELYHNSSKKEGVQSLPHLLGKYPISTFSPGGPAMKHCMSTGSFKCDSIRRSESTNSVVQFKHVQIESTVASASLSLITKNRNDVDAAVDREDDDYEHTPRQTTQGAKSSDKELIEKPSAVARPALSRYSTGNTNIESEVDMQSGSLNQSGLVNHAADEDEAPSVREPIELLIPAYGLNNLLTWEMVYCEPILLNAAERRTCLQDALQSPLCPLQTPGQYGCRCQSDKTTQSSVVFSNVGVNNIVEDQLRSLVNLQTDEMRLLRARIQALEEGLASAQTNGNSNRPMRRTNVHPSSGSINSYANISSDFNSKESLSVEQNYVMPQVVRSVVPPITLHTSSEDGGPTSARVQYSGDLRMHSRVANSNEVFDEVDCPEGDYVVRYESPIVVNDSYYPK
jgi:hypothetical protein